MITEGTNRRVTRGRSAIAAAALLAAVWTAHPSAAQDRGEVTVDVERCLDLESPEERQACFGAQVNQALLKERDPGEAGPGPAEGEPARGSETRNAVPVASERPVASAAQAPDPGGDEYFGTIVEMREYLPSAYLIRLDNGQIWEQTEPKRYPLRPGLEVRIYATRWGDRYRLTGLDSGGHIQVRRVQ